MRPPPPARAFTGPAGPAATAAGRAVRLPPTPGAPRVGALEPGKGGGGGGGGGTSAPVSRQRLRPRWRAGCATREGPLVYRVSRGPVGDV